MNMEFLAHQWKLIDPAKYEYRKSERNTMDGKLPGVAFLQSFFDLKTFKLAHNKIYATTNNGEKVLIEKEFALAGAKLI